MVDHLAEGHDLLHGLWWPKEGGGGREDGARFAYTDGDAAEGHVAARILAARDRSLFSRELHDGIRDWPSRCHLSASRANLLRPLDGVLGGRLLELGSGFGPVTRYLGETGAEVVAVEASPLRAAACRARVVDLPNVEVVCQRIEALALPPVFDAVLMVGVLQYARAYTDLGAGAEDAFLEAARKCLKPDGVLVLAIQNRLGLKYLSGWPEPNVGEPYFGLHGAYGPRTIVRFGRAELKALLERHGFAGQEILYPFPDYHFARTVLSSRALALPAEIDAGQLLAGSVAGDLIRPDWRHPTFSRELAWRSIAANGLVPDLANAFLVVASADKGRLRALRDRPELAWHYSSERRRDFAIGTRFVRRKGAVHVEKTRLAGAEDGRGPVRQALGPAAYATGGLWWLGLVEIVNRPGWTVDQLAAWAGAWRDALIEAAGRRDGVVPGGLVDATPMNAVVDHGRWTFIDQEWTFGDELPLAYVVFRGLLGALANLDSAAPTPEGGGWSVLSLCRDVLARLGFPADDDAVDGHARLEMAFQAEVAGRTASDGKAWLDGLLHTPLRLRLDKDELQAQLGVVSGEVGALRARLADQARLERRIAALEAAAARAEAERRRLREALDGAEAERLAERASWTAALERAEAARGELAEAHRAAEAAWLAERDELSRALAATEAQRRAGEAARLEERAEWSAAYERAEAARADLEGALARAEAAREAETADLARALDEARAGRVKEREEWTAAYDRAEAERAGLEQALAELRGKRKAERAEAREALRAAEAARAELAQALDDAAAERDRAREALRAAEAARAELAQALGDAAAERDRAREALRAAEAMAEQASAAGDLRAAESALEEARRDLAALAATIDQIAARQPV